MAILTISREIGTEGLLIGEAIAEEMGYVLFNKEKVLKELKADGEKWVKLGAELDEHRPNLWEKYDVQYRAFVALAKSHILECASAGKVVIMGRGGNFLLEGIPHALRVRIVAPMDMRLKRATDESSRDYVSSDAAVARKFLLKADKKSRGLMRTVFDKDWNDPRAYDLTINMKYIRREEAEEAIKAMLLERQKRKDASSEELLRMRALAAKIHASIAITPALMVPTLEVVPKEGEIVLKGIVHSAKEHKLIEEKAVKMAGPIPVRCELHYR
jgi:cytidylate kinase